MADDFQQLPEVGQEDAGPVAGPSSAAAACTGVKIVKDGPGIKLRFPGREITLKKGLLNYELYKTGDEIDGIVLYGGTKESIAISGTRVAVFYTEGSSVQFSLKTPVGNFQAMKELLEDTFGIKEEIQTKENPGPVSDYISQPPPALLEEDEVCNVDGGKRRKKTRARKSKRRRTLRKQK